MLEWVKQHWHIDLTAEVPVPWWWLILMSLIALGYSISLLRRGRGKTPAPVTESDRVDLAGARVVTFLLVFFVACTAAVLYTCVRLFGWEVTVFAAGLSGMAFTAALIFSYGKSMVDEAAKMDGANGAMQEAAQKRADRLIEEAKARAAQRTQRWEDLPSGGQIH